MKSITIGLIQSHVEEDISSNVKKTVKMIEEASKKGAKIIALQELFQTPYFPQWQPKDLEKNKDHFAETLSGSTVKIMKETAKRLKVALIVPFYEKKENKYFNTALVIDKNGKSVGHYHKIHIPHDPGFYEKDYFEHGKLGYKTFTLGGVRVAVLICYDQWFPEAARMARLAGAEVIFYPTAIGNIIGYAPEEGDWHEGWELIQRSHAIANSVYVAAINRVGVEGKMQFYGQSFISDPFGKVLKRGSETKEEVIVEKLDLDKNKFYEEGWGFMRNRRPDTYGGLTTSKLIKKSKKLPNVSNYKNVKKILEK
jgi:agmatine deiminase